MRNLKKVLSLVLVVAMLASMMIVGAAAAETETTNYPEAAAVIGGIGVMEGDENGMRYGDTVTREEAAAIICRVLLGDTAETLKTTTAPFADVAASRWSAGYIAYLKAQGIVSGVTDTEFAPTAKVTGIAFAKMLLTAVGYGKNGEFEGAAWDINTITLANQLGVFTGTLAADLTAPATREECMLYGFNVMTKVPTVNYNKTFESYYTGNSALNPVDTTNVVPVSTNTAYTYTLAYKNYTLVQETGNGADIFGRPSTNWKANGTMVAENIACETPDAVLYNGVNSATLYNTLGKTVVTDINKDLAKKVTLYVDGVETTHNFTTIISGQSGINATQITTGATTEVYVDYSTASGYSVTLVTYYEHIGTVSSVSTSNNTLKIGALTVDGNSVDITGIAKKDIVKYTIGSSNGTTADTVATVVVADYTVGTYTGTNAFAQAVIDGTGYSASKNQDGVYASYAWQLTIGTTYKVYTDSLGNLLKVVAYDETGSTGAYEYLYVVDSEAQAHSGSALTGKDAKVALTVVYPNGGTEVLYYAVKYSSSKFDSANGYYITVNGEDKAVTDKLEVAEGWYSYTKNDAGNVTLGYAAGSANVNSTYAQLSTSVTLNTGKATTGISGYTANSKTVLNIVDKKGNVATYTGIANFPAVTAGNKALVTYAANGKVLSTINIYNGTDAVSSTKNFAYCVMANGTSADGNSYMMYIDGVAQFITTTDTLAAGYIYDLTLTDGEYTATKVDALSGDKGTVNAGFGYGALTNGEYAYMDMTTYATKYAEYATVDTVDDNYFTTVAVTDEDIATGDTVVTTKADAKTYYYDANTVVIDCTGAGATEIAEGNVFIAYVDKTASTSFSGELYVSYIWIVG